ncbi:MAG: CIA30 family protein [Deltaproteobacteria bacterium]|nr:CIA30 family protein [Deltaproteobacteria bacterium]
MLTSVGAVEVTDLPWRAVNDTVMGGVSRGRVETGDVVSFAGVLSLEQNGGFTSMRARVPEGSFTGATAVRVELRGDGRTYDLTLRRSDVPLRAGSYRAPVATTEGVTTVEIPLDRFRPTSFGRPVSGAPSLDSGLDEIDTVGFMLADGTPGPFSLEVLALSIVGGGQSPGVHRAPVRRALVAAIGAGVPLFNRGDVQGCRDAYATALAALDDQPGLTPGERSIVAEALATAGTQSAQEAAWTLRHAIDSVLRGGS